MKGDFSRQRFFSWKGYRSVRMQQGRVQLDSDWNEDKEIELRTLRRIVRDVVGLGGTPASDSDNAYYLPLEGTAMRASEMSNVDTSLGDHLFFTWSPVPIDGHYRTRVYVKGHIVDQIYPYMDAPMDAVASGSSNTSFVMHVPSVTMPDGQVLANGTIIAVEGAPFGLTVDGLSIAMIIATITNVTGTTVTAKFRSSGAFPAVAAATIRFFVPYRYDSQPFYKPSPSTLPSSGQYVAYLDVWERHVTAVEDAALKEPALGGPDTTTRTQTVWQMKLIAAPTPISKVDDGTWADVLAVPQPGKLKATYSATPTQSQALENRLYRVEIHQGGTPGVSPGVTFKWSRDNGSIASPWIDGNGPLRVSTLGRDDALGFAENQWLELYSDAQEFAGQPGVFVRITAVALDPTGLQLLTVTPPSGYTIDINNFKPNPRVRRWDGDSGLVNVTSSTFDLENGIQVQFDATATYQTGDHWQIPARPSENGIEWPTSGGAAVMQTAQRIEHSYLALNVVDFGTTTTVTDHRRVKFPSMVRMTKTITRNQSIVPFSRIIDGASGVNWKFGSAVGSYAGFSGYYFCAYNNGVACSGMIPVNLPDKAIVRGLTAWINTSTPVWSVYLSRWSTTSIGTGNAMFALYYGGSPGVLSARTDFANGPYTVDNANWQHYITMDCSGSGQMAILSIIITYDLPLFAI